MTKISLPVGAAIRELEQILNANGIEIDWVQPVTRPEDPTVEYVEMHLESLLADDTVVDRGQGRFLALERFFSRTKPGPDGRDVLCYRVQKQLSPEYFYWVLNHVLVRDLEPLPGTFTPYEDTGTCTASDISDHLVMAFDHGMAGDIGLRSALFAWRAPCGGLVFHVPAQHVIFG